VHCRKPPQGAKFSMHEFFGSSAYLRGAEIVIGLRRLGVGYAHLHWFKDRDGDLPPIGSKWALLYSREEGFRRDPNDGENKPVAKDRVGALLADGARLTIAELMSATGYAERTIKGALKDLGAENDGHNPAHYYLAAGPESSWEARQDELDWD
jgi:hypothetical protein